jgi:hypothetical protein
MQFNEPSIDDVNQTYTPTFLSKMLLQRLRGRFYRVAVACRDEPSQYYASLSGVEFRCK